MLRALDEAAAKIEALEAARTEPIAIIGGACRFPGGARDLPGYWRLLAAGHDATGDMPLDRWDIDALYDPDPEAPGKLCTRRGAFLPEIDRFDADFFKISPREAATLDPQHRLLLEVAHEALDTAGQLGDRLAANLTGVFIGVTNNDYAHLLREHKATRPLDAYFITGNAPNSAAGRLSYQLGLRGPSLVLDTACSSSLASVHTACQSLRAGECHLALAGGVNLLIMPDTYAALSRARMLAADGRCKTFDAAADGYGRGEGAGLIVLKTLAAARRDGDRILAVIRGGAINHDGPSSGFTVPNGAAQRALLQTALGACRLGSTDIDYVEAHGTGTTLGDPIEVNALVDVLGPGRTAANPLLLGSVKTNLGHLESAAGIAGILKVVLALWHRELPRHLHFKNPTPRIAWADIPVEVTAAHRAWPDPGRPRRAGISSFGVSGTNVHLILEESPLDPAGRQALPVPQKQFRGRHRYWAFVRPHYATTREWLHHVTWQPQARRADDTRAGHFDAASADAATAAWLTQAAPRYADAAYRDFLPALEGLAAAYAAAALTALAPSPPAVAPGFATRRLARIQEIATQATAAPATAPACPEAAVEVGLLQRCGENLPAVLRGEIDPLTLLFAAEARPSAADLYGVNPTARFINDLAATWLAAALPPRPAGRTLRVLELGAGTGGTTAAILAALGDHPVDYVFTDVSPAFLASAARRFADRPGLSFRQLDISRDPLAQGFGPGQFDLVVAANVLHATRDLRVALDHVRRLLAAAGQLLLVELTTPLAFLDLVFGLTEGWWHFTDTDLRPAHPLLAPDAWIRLLGEHGFTAVTAHQAPGDAGEMFRQQALLTARAAPARRWLVIGDNLGLAPALGDDAMATTLADAPTQLREHGPWDGVVQLVPVCASATDPQPLQDALTLAHALNAHPTPWWIVTRGAIGDDVGDLAASSLWGFARTVAQEHPELTVRRLDFSTDANVADLVHELTHPSEEDQIQLRAHTRLVPRLAPLDRAEPTEDFTVDPTGTVLIIGGLGGLGLPLARWLGERGARHLVLAGRGPPNDAARTAIERLQIEGLDVRAVRLDVTDEAALASLLAEIAASPAPLRGVIHAAGVLDDGVLRQLSWSRVASVLAPKINGAWLLHRLTRNLPLDFFILFSSSTALLGTPGQANHAAANAWLDALAHHRRAAGLPGLSINWGPWAEVGAAARPEVAAHARRHGLGLIPPAKGFHLLGELLIAAPAQAAVLPVTWAEVPNGLIQAPFFDEVRSVPTAVVPAASSAAASPDAVVPANTDWAALPARTRATRLQEFIRDEAAAVLGLDSGARLDPAKGFFALGMDSLTAVELRNRLQTALGRSLPSTVIFDHPSCAALATHLAGLFTIPTERSIADLLDEELQDL